MKVYIVEADFGQYEDSYTVTLGCFSSPLRAQAAKAVYEEQVDYARQLEPPYGLEPQDYEKIEDLQGDQADDYARWEQDYNLAQDFNFCSIIEHEVIE